MAELRNRKLVSMFDRLYRSEDTYCATLSLVEPRTVANSLIRCGRLPVFSSCSMTAITISSLIPSVSILMSKCESPGEGGGVCATPSRRLLGLKAILSMVETTDAPGEETGDTGVLSPCDRLTRFEGVEQSRWSVLIWRESGERVSRSEVEFREKATTTTFDEYCKAC